jgi:rhodanese-related sulfurtransferase
MDQHRVTVSVGELYARLGTAAAPVIVDVRREHNYGADHELIVGAFHRPPDTFDRWLKDLPTGRSIVAYCVHGHDVSQGVATSLRRAGIEAAYLEGGFAGWKEKHLPTRKKMGVADNRWITREHPKIDRIACPWLISRFINPLAEFIYVPANDVPAVAKEREAIPYDVKGAEFGHVGDHCSFDAIIRIYEVKDPALNHLANRSGPCSSQWLQASQPRERSSAFC